MIDRWMMMKDGLRYEVGRRGLALYEGCEGMEEWREWRECVTGRHKCGVPVMGEITGVA